MEEATARSSGEDGRRRRLPEDSSKRRRFLSLTARRLRLSVFRVYFIPQAFLSGSAGNAAGTTSSSACPCVRQAFHMFGLEALPLPPLSLDVCVANPPAPPPKKEKKPAAAAAVAGSEGNSGSAALASGAGAGGAGSTSSGSAGDGSLRQAFVSTITTKTSSRSQQPRETLQQAGPESAPEEETPLQPLVGGLVLAVVGARVGVCRQLGCC